MFLLLSISAIHLPFRVVHNENSELFSKYLQTKPYDLFLFNLQHYDILEDADKFNSFLISSKQSQIFILLPSKSYCIIGMRLVDLTPRLFPAILAILYSG